MTLDWLILAYAGIFLSGIGVLVICISGARTLSALRSSVKTAEACMADLTDITEDALTVAKDVNDTLKKVEKNLEPIMIETNILLQNTNILAEDLQVKSEKLDPLFDSANELAGAVGNLQNSVENMKDNFTNSTKEKGEKISKNVEKATNLLNKFKKKDDVQEEIKED